MGCGDCGATIVKGAAGLAKAALGIDRAPPAVVQARRDVCRGCPFATRNPAPRYAATAGLTSLSQCLQCSCVISVKTLIASERCPIGRW